jgi:two-component sensor histidine kinase
MIRQFLGPLRRRLILVFFIVLAVPTAFGIVAAVDHFQSQVEQARRSTERYATLASNDETNLLWQSQRIVDDLAHDPVIRTVIGGTGNFDACAATLKKAIDPYPAYAVASVLAPDGAVLCRSTGNRAKSTAASQDWFKEVITSRRAVLSGYTFAQILNEPILAYAMPVSDAEGKVIAVLGLGIRLRWLAASGQEPGLPPEASVDLLDKDGKPLVISDANNGSGGLPDDAYLKRVVTGGALSFEATGRDSVQRYYAVHPIAGGSLYILLGQPTRTLIAPLQRDLGIQIATLTLVVLGGLAAALIGSQLLVTRWIARLTEEARTITLGEAPEPYNFSGAPTEIRELNDTLMTMAARIKAREAELNESLVQKQMMLREIHHRVKNNLQTVTSLLNLYARIPRGEAIKQAFADVQTRINTLALVHRHLYESQDLREIDLAPFMSNLVRLIQDGSGVPTRRVRLKVEIPQITLSGDRAVPLALLTTEILTNAFKHAFPDHRAGNILVQMRTEADGKAVLTITDDGVGAGAAPEPQNVIGSAMGTMGQNLIGAFTRQLGGKLTSVGPPGTTITLDFDLEAKPAAPIEPKDAENAA